MEEEIKVKNLEMDFNKENPALVKNYGGPYKFGKRAFPPHFKLDPNASIPFRTGREKLRHNTNFVQTMQTKLAMHLKEQKFRGFKILKTPKVASWDQKKFDLNGVRSKAWLRMSTMPSDNNYSKMNNRYIQEYNNERNYNTSIPLTNLLTSQPMLNQMSNLSSTNNNSNKKERIPCPVMGCNKDFSDRSSLNRHKKNLHPELYIRN